MKIQKIWEIKFNNEEDCEVYFQRVSYLNIEVPGKLAEASPVSWSLLVLTGPFITSQGRMLRRSAPYYPPERV